MKEKRAHAVVERAEDAFSLAALLTGVGDDKRSTVPWEARKLS